MVRYFIITPGRTGSSLLAAVLADCGADFGQSVDDWDRNSGAYENRDVTRAARHAIAMFRYGVQPQWPERGLWRWHRRQAKKYLRRALSEHAYFKMMHGHTLLGLAAQIGYRPRVILSTRDLRGYLESRATALHTMMYEHILADYRDSMRNGRLAIKAFGGASVDFSDLTNPSSKAWAEELGVLCGIKPSALVMARDLRLKPPRVSRKSTSSR